MGEKDHSLMSNIYDIIIVGGGPAGLTAGLYAARARLKTLLVESYLVVSQATTTDWIENYPGFSEGIGGFELMDRFKKQAEGFGLKLDIGDVRNILRDKDVWQIETEEKRYRSLSIIVAAGARPRELGAVGEEKFRGRGVSYCATCDGAFFRDKDIVVVGGGDTAVEEALFLTRFAKKITLIHRRDRLRATKLLQERILAHQKVGFVLSSNLIEIIGKEAVEAVRVKNVASGEESLISCDGVFIFVGLIPNTNFLKGIVELDKAGYVIANENMETSRKGIFACGDCRQKPLRQIVTACGDGATAAFSAQQYVEELKGVAYK